MRGSSDSLFPKSQELIDNILSGKKLALVPPLILLETIHALRAKIAQTSTYNAKKPYGAVKSQINSITNTFLSRMAAMGKKRHVLLIQPNINLADHHNRILDQTTNYFGQLITISICPHCKKGRIRQNEQNQCPYCNMSLYSIKQYSYKGLGHADWEHAYFALSNKVKEFYSADKSFQHLRSNPEFNNIDFHIL